MSVIPSAMEGKQKPIEKAWGETTNPTEHDPAHFRYLVHLVTGGAGPSFSLDTPQFSLGALGFGMTAEHDLSRLPRVSSTLVDPNHTATFIVGRWGYILSAANNDVLATSPNDIGSDAFRLGEDDLATQYPPQEAEELLNATDPFRHNEVLLRGGNLDVTGLFYLSKEFPDKGPSYTDQDLYEVSQIAANMTLPLIAI